MSVRAALEEIDLSSVMAALLDQEEQGHTAESDAEEKLDHFASLLIRRSQEASDVLREGGRQDLAVGYRRAARLAGVCLATMRRIRREQGGGRHAD